MPRPEIYIETVAILAKVQSDCTGIQEELNSKIEEFATPSDKLEEVFENREQIELANLLNIFLNRH
jgi:hypothetical protein